MGSRRGFVSWFTKLALKGVTVVDLSPGSHSLDSPQHGRIQPVSEPLAYPAAAYRFARLVRFRQEPSTVLNDFRRSNGTRFARGSSACKNAPVKRGKVPVPWESGVSGIKNQVKRVTVKIRPSDRPVNRFPCAFHRWRNLGIIRAIFCSVTFLYRCDTNRRAPNLVQKWVRNEIFNSSNVSIIRRIIYDAKWTLSANNEL